VFEKYKHEYASGGSATVWVNSELKGKHRQHCLCFSCEKFIPNTENNCKIAKEVFKNCVTFNITTPMYECPEFTEHLESKVIKCVSSV
jgi:hypothetical protein